MGRPRKFPTPKIPGLVRYGGVFSGPVFPLASYLVPSKPPPPVAVRDLICSAADSLRYALIMTTVTKATPKSRKIVVLGSRSVGTWVPGSCAPLPVAGGPRLSCVWDAF